MIRTTRKRAGIGIGVGLLVALVAPAAANAANVSLPANDLNKSGSLVQYSTYRTHASGGAGVTLNNNTSTYTRLGLRNTSDDQITNSIQFNTASGDQDWVRSSNGSATIPSGSYALNGRMGATSDPFADYTWGGTLHI